VENHIQRATESVGSTRSSAQKGTHDDEADEEEAFPPSTFGQKVTTRKIGKKELKFPFVAFNLLVASCFVHVGDASNHVWQRGLRKTGAFGKIYCLWSCGFVGRGCWLGLGLRFEWCRERGTVGPPWVARRGCDGAGWPVDGGDGVCWRWRG